MIQLLCNTAEDVLLRHVLVVLRTQRPALKDVSLNWTPLRQFCNVSFILF